MTSSSTRACILALAASLAPAQPEVAGPGLHLYPPAGLGASSHRLTPAAEGLILSWIEPGPAGARLCWARLTDEGWSDAITVTEQQTGMVANWADLPAVVEGGDGAMYAHWLRQSAPRSPGYDIIVLRSLDQGVTWSELGKLNDDDVNAEHGFVSYLPHEGGLRTYWLDGRDAGEATGDPDIRLHGRMTLRTALVGEAIAPSELIDSAVCDCCNTAAVLTADGPRVLYRDRADGEIRDIAIAGEGLPEGLPVHGDNWNMPGCPVNGPAAVAEGERVIVAWYTAAGGAKVHAAFSDDSGATFADPILLDKTASASIPIGRVDLVRDGDDAIVCWLRNERRKGGLFVQRVTRDGPAGEALKVGPMEASAAGGFPQMERLGDELILIWRDAGAERLQMARVPVDSVGR